MIKHVSYGKSFSKKPIYVISMFKTEHGNWKVEVSPCDINGFAVSDPVAWDMFPTWWDARKYVSKKYKEFYKYVNERD